MIAKKATQIAKTLGQGLAEGALEAAVRHALNIGNAMSVSEEKECDSVINAYRQIEWDTEDELIGKPTLSADGVAAVSAKATKSVKPATKTKIVKETKRASKKVMKSRAAAEKAKKSTEPKVKKPGTDAKLRELILAGKTNEQALAATLKAFPKAKTSMACASWNRSQLRNHGEKYGLTKAQMAKVLTNAQAGEKK